LVNQRHRIQKHALLFVVLEVEHDCVLLSIAVRREVNLVECVSTIVGRGNDNRAGSIGYWSKYIKKELDSREPTVKRSVKRKGSSSSCR